jgi:hypothetical protein
MDIKTCRMEVSSEIIAEVGRLGLAFTEIPIRPIYTEYSKRKGQKNSNSLAIFAKLIMRKSL